VHPKLAAVEHTGAGGAPLIPEMKLSDLELARQIAFLLDAGVRAAAEREQGQSHHEPTH